MEPTVTMSASATSAQVLHDLWRLSVPVHLSGHQCLCVAIPKFATNISQLMCGELYPAVAKELGYVDWRAVEFAIRRVIQAAWTHRDPEIWNEYFSGSTKAPSNKQFIATLAQRIKNTPFR